MHESIADNPYDGIVQGLILAYEMTYIRLKHAEKPAVEHFSPISNRYVPPPTYETIKEVISIVKTLAHNVTREDFIRAEVEAQLTCGLDSDFIHWKQN